MFGFNHYVPILRWKAAEKEAVYYINEKIRNYITPLFEIIMPRPKLKKNDGTDKDSSELRAESIDILKNTIVPKIPSEILKIWGSTREAFIDVNLLDSTTRSLSLYEIVTNAEKFGVKFIPVISLNSSPEMYSTVISLVYRHKLGVCLRLFRSDLSDKTTLENRIKEFFEKFSLSKKDVDLIMDLQICDEVCLKLFTIIQSIPNILEWRSFTVSSGAFPQDLSQWNEPGKYTVPRLDWSSWLTQIRSGKLLRKPSFSDYTIQHPVYKEPVGRSNPSASIRYTSKLKDEWIVMRGQGLYTKNGSGAAQYPANALLLTQLPEYCGPTFSYGDEYIDKKGKNIKTKETGNPRTWLRAGINHHLTLVATQISNLSL